MKLLFLVAKSNNHNEKQTKKKNEKEPRNDYKEIQKDNTSSFVVILCLFQSGVLACYYMSEGWVSRGPLSYKLSDMTVLGIANSSYLLIIFHIRILKAVYLAFIYYTKLIRNY